MPVEMMLSKKLSSTLSRRLRGIQHSLSAVYVYFCFFILEIYGVSNISVVRVQINDSQLEPISSYQLSECEY